MKSEVAREMDKTGRERWTKQEENEKERWTKQKLRKTEMDKTGRD